MTLLMLGLLACDTDPVQTAAPGPLQAGVARARIPAPVGIGTAGFGGFGVSDAPQSPFSEIYPATQKVHGHPEIKAVVLSRGEGEETIFVRLDTVGVFQQLRRAVVLELEERLGRDLDDALIIGATHTHSGPGRVIDGGGIFNLIADEFHPEFYSRIVGTIADTVEAAYADLADAELGLAWGYSADGHSDRRCEDGLDYENGTIPLLAVQREGEIDALVMAYAIHGTSLGIEEFTLSQDASGAIEQAVEDGFGHPVEVLMFNSWGADMSPGSPDIAVQEGAEISDEYPSMKRVGQEVSAQVHAALGGVEWMDDPRLETHLYRARIDREAIGYTALEFPFEYGGVYCDAGDSDCDESTTVDGLDQSCIPFNDEYPAPNQTMFTAGRVGDLALVTFPGEPGTLLAEKVMDEIRTSHPDIEQLAFFGYTQDYLGYSILEEDWWQGGYEASGALWGPQQGDYLAFQAVEAFRHHAGGPVLDEVPPITPFDDPEFTPYAAEGALELGAIVSDVAESYGATGLVEFTIHGGDPWLGAPLATVVDEGDSPVLRPGGIALDSDDLNFEVQLAVSPTYEDEDRADRRFAWTFRLPVQSTTPGGVELADGRYRVSVSVPVDGSEPVTVESAEFEIVR